MGILSFKDNKSELDSMRSVFNATERGALTARPVFNSYGDVVDFRYGLANRAALDLLDLKREEISGKTISEIFQDKAEECIQRYSRVWQTGEKFVGEVMFDIRGIKHWFEVRIVHASQELVIFFKDVTLAKQTSLDREQFERLRDTLLNNSTASMWVKNRLGKYTFVNQGFKDLMGKNLWEIIGKSDEEFFDSKLTAEFQETDRQVLQTRQPLTVVQHIPVEGSHKIFVTQKFPVYDESGSVTGVAGISSCAMIPAQSSPS